MNKDELTVCGSQLIVDFVEYSLDDVKTKEELREVLSEYIPEWNSGDRESGLLFPPDSVNDNNDNSEELLIKKSGDLISRPTEGNILFVSYYFYDDEVYKVPLINNEPVTAIVERFNGESYLTQYFQGDQNLDADSEDVGEHNADVSWQFMLHNKTISMEDIRGIDCESEDMSELVDNVYAFYEGYLSSNKEVQIKSENRVVVSVCLGTVMLALEDWDDCGLDEDGAYTQEAKDYAIGRMKVFIDDIGDKVEGFIGEKILLSDNGKDFHELNERANTIEFKYYDSVKIYFLLTKEISGDELNYLFLDMPDFGQFIATFPNDGELIGQSYDYGEYDTGYFAGMENIFKFESGDYILGHVKEAGGFKFNDESPTWYQGPSPYHEEAIKAYNNAVEMLLE